MDLILILVIFIILQRLFELYLSHQNTKRQLSMGAKEFYAGHYYLFILLHAAWIITIAIEIPYAIAVYYPLIGLFFILQLLRLWVIFSLGPFWTTRIISMSNTPLVKSGPYKYLKHPNYMIVCAEIAVLPLAFFLYKTVIIFSILNALLVYHRIQLENKVISVRENL